MEARAIGKGFFDVVTMGGATGRLWLTFDESNIVNGSRFFTVETAFAASAQTFVDKQRAFTLIA